MTEYWDDETKVTLVSTKNVNLKLPITAVKCYLIKNNNILLVKDDKRGWDVPGGHIEKNESPKNALKREMEEEARCKIKNILLIGYLHCHQLKSNSKYPLNSLIAVYTGLDFELDLNRQYLHEVSESKFISLDKVKSYHHNWSSLKQFIVEMIINGKYSDF